MVSQLVRGRNEERLRRGFFGWEPLTSPGVAVPLTSKLYQKLRLTDARPLTGAEEDTGGFDPYTDREQGITTVTGTLSGPLSYEDMYIFLRAAISGELAGTSDGGTPPAYALTGIPSFDTDNLSSLTVEHGAPDDPFLSTMVYLTEVTFAWDVDGSDSTFTVSANVIARSMDRKTRATGTATGGTSTTMTVSGAAWTANQWAGGVLQITGGVGVGQERVIASNTATVLTVTQPFSTTPDATSVFRIIPGSVNIADRTRELIKVKGTKLFIDDYTGTIGTTQMLGRMISGSVTITLNRQTKVFAEDISSVSARTGRGSRNVTWQLRLEWDRERLAEAKNEHAHFQSGDLRRVRIEQTGKIIHDAVSSRIRIDLPKAKYASWSDSPRQANMALTLSGEAYLDEILGYVIAVPTISRVASIV